MVCHGVVMYVLHNYVLSSLGVFKVMS